MADESGEERSDDLEYKEGGLPIGLIITGIVAVIAAVFIVQNSDETEMEFLFFSGRVPLSLVIIIAIALGALLGWFGGYMRRRKKRRDA
ncbi:MAG: hypothetical protein BMS9Abin12_0352 [Acidimicrobiia bacterium]|nr:MAG: hypothetical protein BMS9Abin12_0352 [Acidimicrobiia bacterium]